MKQSCYPSACQAALPALAPTRPRSSWPQDRPHSAEPGQNAPGLSGPGRRAKAGLGRAELVLIVCQAAVQTPALAARCKQQVASAICVGRGTAGVAVGRRGGWSWPQPRRPAQSSTARRSRPAAGMHGAARLRLRFVTLPGCSRPFATCFICLPVLTWHQTGVKLLNHFKIVLIFCFVLISTAPINQLTGPGS